MNELKVSYPRILGISLKRGHISETTHKRLSKLKLETLDEQEFAYDELIHSIKSEKEQQIQTIYNRIIKGAEMIDAEQDPSKKQSYLKIYDSLLQKLESLKGA